MRRELINGKIPNEQVVELRQKRKRDIQGKCGAMWSNFLYTLRWSRSSHHDFVRFLQGERDMPKDHRVGDGQPYTCSPEVHVESNYATEKIDGNTLLQRPFAGLALGGADSQGIAVPETDNITIKHTPLSPTSLNAKPAPSLTNYKSMPVEEASFTIQSSSDIHIIKVRTKKTVELTGPITRAKAKKQAAKAYQRSTDFQTLDRKARPYS